MRFLLLLTTLAAGAWAAEPNLPHQAPEHWAAKKNPLAGDPQAAKAGAKLYARECAECHGPTGGGIGKTPSLRQPAVSQAPAGALNWVIWNGAIFHGLPAFSHLPEGERWQIVTFLRSLSGR